MSGSYSILVGLGTDVANFVKQVLVFVAMLFFLITSENGGVMEQVLHMIPLSELTRHKCASVLDRTISAVLVTTGLVHVSPLQVLKNPLPVRFNIHCFGERIDACFS